MTQIIQDLNWRYATKKFNSDKKISPQDLDTIKTGLQLSASSYGLQLYKFFIVEDPAVRAQLQKASWGQSQIAEASHLIVMAARTEVVNHDIDHFLELVSETRGAPMEALAGYGSFMKSKVVEGMPLEHQAAWTARQTYIALGNLLNIAAHLKIDSTPIEGFEPAQYDEILGLAAKGYTATVVCTLGYRSDEDDTAKAPKVRKPQSQLFEVI